MSSKTKEMHGYFGCFNDKHQETEKYQKQQPCFLAVSLSPFVLNAQRLVKNGDAEEAGLNGSSLRKSSLNDLEI